MCGIFGYIGYISKERALVCIDTLTHRGPDARGIWRNREITLGHRRLSILDLSIQGNQPMSYANERYWITFNGEIYNFIEIRNQLKSKGYTFQSDTDTEVILASFIEWGEECLSRFNGMWAFGIWDTQEKKLFLSRDRFGKKPLFYIFLPDGNFAFASEMKALFPLIQEIYPNTRLISRLKTYKAIDSYESTEECVIKGITRFSAGHFAWVQDGNIKLSRWWCTLDHLMDVPKQYEKQVSLFQELFLDACRLRMRSDVATGTALSGGLDSSSTISAMAFLAKTDHGERLNRNWQHAFVASFPDTPLDEDRYAEMVTEYLGIEASFIRIDPLETLARLKDYYLFEEIYAVSPTPFMMTYQAMRNHGVYVSLDGHGSDELFAGYPADFRYAIPDAGLDPFKAMRIFKTIQNCQTHWHAPQPEKFRLTSQFSQWGKQSTLKICRKLLKHPPHRHISEIPCRDASHPQWDKLGFLDRRLYAITHEGSLPTLLRNYDRYSMANGVEIRMPFMDHRIISFAFSIPWTSKIREGFSKAIVRDAMSSFMPYEIAYRPSKVGFSSPVTDWMKGPWRSFCLDTIHSASFKSCSLIEADVVAQRVKDVIEKSEVSFSEGVLAWAFLTPYLWEQAVIKRCYHRDS